LIHTKALFYPYTIPPDSWIKEHLLLCDAVSSIVPEYAEVSDPTLDWLRKEKAWLPTFAHDLIVPGYREEIREALVHFADDDSMSFRNHQYPSPPELRRLILGKLNDSIDQTLEELGLGKRQRKSYSYLVVHKDVAEVVLSITAKYLAADNRSSSERIILGTDNPKAARYAVARHSHGTT